MTRLRHSLGRVAAVLLPFAVGAAAQAQYPRSYSPTRSTTSVITQLPVDTVVRRGQTRQLVCRGGGAMDIQPQADPSPRDPRFVAVAIRYASNTVPVGEAYQGLQPGACSWNPYAFPNAPAEPGVVVIDLDRQGSEFVPNPATIATYLRDARHYWLFYVDDVSNFSNSHGSYGGEFRAVPGTQPAPAKPAATRRERLRCRGGAGLSFTRHGSAGGNLVLMKLAYPPAATAAGPIGAGLAPGTCAWAERDSIQREPGRVSFVTPRNAQLEQVRSGGTIDKSTTAAERWPDAQTIPVYMIDPAHYWTFAVSPANPDSALRHSAWNPHVPEAAAADPDPGSAAPGVSGPVGTYRPGLTPTTRSGPTSAPSTPGVGERTPGSGTSFSYDVEVIRSLSITPSLNGVEMRFQGGERTPLVQINLEPPVREPSSGRWFFPGAKQDLGVSGSSGGAPRNYSAASTAPLTRNTVYHYLINAPEPTGTLGRPRLPGPEHQSVGTFRTLRSTVRVRFDRVHIIDDSDEDSNGDLAFAFEVNDMTALEMGTGLAQRSPGTLLDWPSGSTHDIGDEFEAEDQDRLRIQVSGLDDDAAVGHGTLRKGWLATPGGDSDGDWNQARAEYRLDQYPGNAFDFPFKVRTGPGSTLQFEAEGRVFVTRE